MRPQQHHALAHRCIVHQHLQVDSSNSRSSSNSSNLLMTQCQERTNRAAAAGNSAGHRLKASRGHASLNACISLVKAWHEQCLTLTPASFSQLSALMGCSSTAMMRWAPVVEMPDAAKRLLVSKSHMPRLPRHQHYLFPPAMPQQIEPRAQAQANAMLQSPCLLQLLVLLPCPFPACWPPSPGRVLNPSCKYAPSVMCNLSIRLLLSASAVYLPKAAGARMERKCIMLS